MLPRLADRKRRGCVNKSLKKSSLGKRFHAAGAKSRFLNAIRLLNINNLALHFVVSNGS
jgi:hypothetical protein